MNFLMRLSMLWCNAGGAAIIFYTPPGMKKMEDYRYSGLQKKLFVITVVLLFLILAS